MKILFIDFLSKPLSIKDKFLLFEKISNNVFLSNTNIYEFQELFCRFQKFYRFFSKFSLFFKIKQAKILVDCDLNMNKLNPSDNHVFRLFQDNNIYLFHIRELLKIIQYSISNSNEFFHEPLPIKNPFNNALLNKSSLYNIYFFVKFNTFIHSELFTIYFKTNFNLSIFSKKSKYILRKHAIINYFAKETTQLYEDTLDMIYYYNRNMFLFEQTHRISIDSGFPKNTLVEIMKPYLKLYLIYLYSYVDDESIRAENELITRLKKLVEFNPNFGKITQHYTKTIIGNPFNINNIFLEPVIKYNSNYPLFDKDESNFLLSHMI
jgi:hypothetical protein